MKDILSQVLHDIKPSSKEEVDVSKKIKSVINKIQGLSKEYIVVLGGSGEKGTWLRNTHDVDIFVKFPYSYAGKSDQLSNILESKLKKIFKIRRLHGSRDYFQTNIDGYIYEIVPILDIKKSKDAINITDVSPLHAEWVKKHKQCADEIRLTKQFFKAAKVYGAESYINGFSGYICEILTIHYKGFGNLVKSITKWKPKVILDTEGHHRKGSIMLDMDKAKTQGPLVIIDPVQADRNAAAAMNEEKFNKIIKYSKEFIKKPSKEFFIIKGIDLADLEKKAKDNELYTFEATPLSGKEDVVGCKLLKVYEYIRQSIKKSEFEILYSDWEWEKKALFFYIIRKSNLSLMKTIKGPPVTLKKYVAEFQEKHKSTFIENNIIYAKEKRGYTLPNQLMNALLKDKYIKERVKLIKLQ
jgi:tRNA nucleotidyltransferase (CCA-adding enzyme)